jgi:hypothetical protein
MEEKTVPLLNLTDITSARASLRRRISLFDLTLPSVAKALLSPDQLAQWTGAPLNTNAPQSPRSDNERLLASPRNAERRYTHLQPSHRAANTIDRLAVPCKKPHFLGEDAVDRGLDELASASSRSRGSKILYRLSTLSPRGKDKPSSDTDAETSGEAVVALLRGLLQDRRKLDQSCQLRALTSRIHLAEQVDQIQACIRALGAALTRFAPVNREAQAMREKLLRLVAWDADLYASVLSWVERLQPSEIRLHAVDVADLLRSPLDDAAILQAVQWGVDANEAVAYREAQWSLAPARLPGQFNDRRLVAQSDGVWASGGMASVYRLVYEADPAPLAMVWKRDDPRAGSIGSDLIGITGNPARGVTPPHWASRNLASYRVAVRLGLSLVPRTEWAVHEGVLGTVMAIAGGLAPSAKGPLSLTLDAQTAAALKNCAGGLEALARQFRFCSVDWSDQAADTLVFDQYLIEYKFDDDDYVLDQAGERIQVKRREQVWVCQNFDSPSLRRDLTRLQWLDHLTGQVDRNPMNYLVAWDDGGCACLSAIDNDLSFPAVADVPLPSGVNSIWLPNMPTVIDADLATAILGLGDDDWQKCLHGLLMSNEFQFACERLANVKAQVQRLKREGRVFDPTDRTWASAEMAACLGLPGIDQAVLAATDDQLGDLWLEAAQHSYLKRDATKQAMVLSGRERMATFEPAAIRAYVKDELLKG